MEKVRTPKVKILYNKKDISKDISKTLLSVNYSDAEEGETDDLSLELEDVGGLWSDSWYPTKGDTLELSIGYDDVLVYCGSFVIDELQIKKIERFSPSVGQREFIEAMFKTLLKSLTEDVERNIEKLIECQKMIDTLIYAVV